METETAVAIVRQNGLSSASCRASVAVTPMCVTADLVNPGGRWPTTGTYSIPAIYGNLLLFISTNLFKKNLALVCIHGNSSGINNGSCVKQS